uniref:non-specific serine/threonine protein kinase n=1 Tax=Oryza meridionalis TaxID=40149 RepID=A0A0E0EX79_9ORYZ
MSKMKTLSLLSLLFFLGLNQQAHVTGDDNFVYSGFADSKLILNGAAMVMPNGLLDLTNGSVRLKGHAIYPTPMRFRGLSNRTVQSFSASFIFGIVSPHPSNGFTFFISPGKNFSDALPTQYFGLLNDQNNGRETNHIFAIELDTIQNSEFQDINDNHIGIDINSLHSVQSDSACYYDDRHGLLKNLTLVSGDPMQVWVDYDRVATLINVTMAPLNFAKPSRALISTSYNLSTVLTELAYVGFSSAAGKANARHYILGWSFATNGPAPAIDIRKLPKMPHIGSKDWSNVIEIVLPIATAAFILTVGGTIFVLTRRYLRYTELREDWEAEFGPHRFSYKDLLYATEGFKNKHLLGSGGFGRVYKGLLPRSSLEIAVKRVSRDSKQGIKEFITEVVSIGHLQHRNLVPLLGYCRRNNELLLVYEFMPNGSLDKYLLNEDGKPTLSWAQRVGIIKDIASSLLYLHHECEKVIIHRDIKASNVLLDNEMNGRLGDFGLARLYDHGVNSQTTHVVGTIGYLAPELASTGKPTPLTDVFSFGIFILEVVCGHRPIMKNEENHTMLVDWVLEHLQNGSLTDTVDTNLSGNYDNVEACLVLKLGLLCSHPFMHARPSMRQVMQYLNGDIPQPDYQLMPTQMSFEMLSLMQNDGFDHYIMSFPSLTTSYEPPILPGER